MFTYKLASSNSVKPFHHQLHSLPNVHDDCVEKKPIFSEVASSFSARALSTSFPFMEAIAGDAVASGGSLARMGSGRGGGFFQVQRLY